MHRSPPPGGSSRWLVVLVAAAVVALLPGVARADGPALPAPPTDPVGALSGALGGALPGGGAAASDPATGRAGTAATPAGTPGGQLPAPGGSPPPLDPSALQPLLDALGISPECSAAVQKDLQAAVQDLPATVQAIVDAIAGQLAGGGQLPLSAKDPQTGAAVVMQALGNGQPPSFTSPDPAELPTIKDLQQLVQDMQKLCMPKLPTSKPPTSKGSSLPPPAATVPQPPPAAAPAAVPVAQPPVSYPGYAPTGAAPVDAGGPRGLAGLAAIAGVVLLSAAGAAGVRTVLRAGPRP